MTKRISLVVLFLSLIFTSIGQAQNIFYNAETTLDSAQIAIVDTNDRFDQVEIRSSDQEKKCSGCVEKNALRKTYYINVALGKGDNEFILIGFKNNRPVTTYVVNILGVEPDSKAKKAYALRVGSATSPVGINQNSSFNETLLNARAPQPGQTTVPVAYFGPKPDDGTPNPSSADRTSLTERPLSLKSFVPTGLTALSLPVPEPSPSDAQKARDSEDTRIPLNPKARLIVGSEQVGASSSTSKGRPFVDLLVNIPVGQLKVDYKHELKVGCNPVPKVEDCKVPIKRYFANSFWTSFKLTSSPTQTLPDLGGLTAPVVNGFFGSNNSSKVNELVQAFEMKIGWETTVRKGFSLIAGVGATSPLTAEKSVLAYKIPRLANGAVQLEFQRIFGQGQDLTGINNLILTSGDRDRFMRNWFVGGRLRHQIVGKADEAYPAVFELTVGQDEVLTNRLIGGVLKFDSFVPIPIKGLRFLYFGASFTSKLTRKVHTTTFPFFLEPATDVNIFANTNFVRNIRDIRELNSDRDGFSFRFGVDLIQLLNRREDKPPVAATPAVQIRKPLYQ